MATKHAFRRWTYEEFSRLPDDGNRCEVIDGELHVTPSARKIHQILLHRLQVLLEAFVAEHDLGELIPDFDVLFAEGDYLRPDLIFVRRERAGIATERGCEAAPDLVVEIASDSTADRDRGVKRQRYAWFGVPEYWVVDPEARQIEVYRMTENPAVPRVERERMVWRLVPGGPELDISISQLLRGFEG